jgi:hypothetical protein
MRLSNLLILFLIGFTLCANAQTADSLKPYTPQNSDTNIRIIASTPVNNTLQKVEQYEQMSHGTFSGYRIQVHFGSDRTGAATAKSDFSSKYPSCPSYLTYQQPYFKVCVGDFRNKLEAVDMLNKIKKDYPGAFVIRDKINPPPLH